MKTDEEIIATGYPPIAEGVALIDFDGVISPFGYPLNFPEPISGAKESLLRMKEAGLRVVVFTSRLSPVWLETVNQTMHQHVDYINEYFRRYIGFEPDAITAQKIPAMVYIDDRAYRFENNWEELTDTILGGK